MIRLAVAGHARLGGVRSGAALANGPSYTFDTLAAFIREGLTPLQIFFITGADAFAEIATWHRYPDVLDLAHFVVVARPGTALASLPRAVCPISRRA